MKNRPLRILYIKTAVVSVLAALVTFFRFDPAWGAAYAAAAALGLVNWILLGLMLIALTEKRAFTALMWLGAKVVLLLGFCLAVLPQTGFVSSAFIAGLGTFLFVALLEALSGLLLAVLRREPGRPIPKDIRSLLTGTATNG